MGEEENDKYLTWCTVKAPIDNTMFSYQPCQGIDRVDGTFKLTGAMWHCLALLDCKQISEFYGAKLWQDSRYSCSMGCECNSHVHCNICNVSSSPPQFVEFSPLNNPDILRGKSCTSREKSGEKYLFLYLGKQLGKAIYPIPENFSYFGTHTSPTPLPMEALGSILALPPHPGQSSSPARSATCNRIFFSAFFFQGQTVFPLATQQSCG